MSDPAGGGLLDRARRAVRKLSDAGIVRDAGVLAGGTAVAQAITVAAAPLLTRLYPPADFGVLAVFGSTVSLISVAAALKYDGALPLPERDDDAAHLLVLSLLLLTLTTAATVALSWAFGARLAAWTDAPALATWWWLIPLGTLGAGGYQIFSFWAMRESAYPVMAKTRVARGVAKIGTQIGLGLPALGLGPVGLLAGEVLGRGVGTTSLAALPARRLRELTEGFSLDRCRALAARYRKFPLFESGAALLYTAGMQLPPLLMAVSFSSRETGWFALSQNVIGMPIGLVAHAVAQAYVGNSSELARTDPSELKRLFRRTVRQLAVVGAIPALLLFFFGPALFSFVFGTEWRAAGVYARILSVLFLAQFIVTPFSHTLNLVDRQELSLAWEVARFLLVLAAFVAAPLLVESTAETTLIVYSGSVALAYVGLFWIYARAIHDLARSDGEGEGEP